MIQQTFTYTLMFAIMVNIMTWKIGELAQKAGVTHRNIRYYEELLLITLNYTGKKRYRYYDDSHLYKLQSIKLLQKLGYGLKDIAAAVAPILGSDGQCPPSGKEIANNLRQSLLNKKKEFEEKIIEFNGYIKGIEEFLPELSVCLDCQRVPTPQDCGKCQIGNSQVIQLAQVHATSSEAENI